MGNRLLYKAAKHRAETLEALGCGADLALIWKIATNKDEEYADFAKVFRKELIDEYKAYCKEAV